MAINLRSTPNRKVSVRRNFGKRHASEGCQQNKPYLRTALALVDRTAFPRALHNDTTTLGLATRPAADALRDGCTIVEVFLNVNVDIPVHVRRRHRRCDRASISIIICIATCYGYVDTVSIIVRLRGRDGRPPFTLLTSVAVQICCSGGSGEAPRRQRQR